MYYGFDEQGYPTTISKDKPHHSRWTQEVPPYTVSGRLRRYKGKWVVQEYHLATYEPYFRLSGEIIQNMYIPEISKSILPRTGTEDVTVLIPCYKQEKYLKEAVVSALQQQYTGHVYIHVHMMYDEDNPTPSQKKFGQYLMSLSKSVTVYWEPRTDISLTRNRMVRMCDTDWFIMVDADEALGPSSSIATLVNTDADVVFTRPYIKDFDIQEPWGQPLRMVNPCHALYSNLTCLMHKQAWNEVGGCDEELYPQYGEDTDFILRLLQLNKYRVKVTNVPHLNRNMRTASKYYWEYQWQIYAQHIGFVLQCMHNSGHSYKMIKRMNWFKEHATYDGFRQLQPVEAQRNQDEVLFAMQYNELLDKMEERTSNYEGTMVSFNNAPIYPVGKGIDSIIFMDVRYTTYENPIPVLVRVDWCKTIEGMSDIERMKWLLQNGKCTFVAYTGTEVVRTKDEFLQQWLGHQPYTTADIDLTGPCSGHAVSFILDKKCNKDCPYCNNPEECNHLSFEQLYENFDKALTHVEHMYPNNVHPQILGGEPTLWPDWFIQKIQDRLRPYEGKYLLFTNGFNRDSLWYSGDNRPEVLQWHITDWKDMQDIKLLPDELPVIVVTHQDIPYLDNFLMRFAGKHPDMFIQPCVDAPGYELDDKDLQYLSRKLDEYNIRRNSVTGRGVPHCTAQEPIWNIDCDTMKAMICRKPGEWVPLEDMEKHLEGSTCRGCKTHRC